MVGSSHDPNFDQHPMFFMGQNTFCICKLAMFPHRAVGSSLMIDLFVMSVPPIMKQGSE